MRTCYVSNNWSMRSSPLFKKIAPSLMRRFCTICNYLVLSTGGGGGGRERVRENQGKFPQEPWGSHAVRKPTLAYWRGRVEREQDAPGPALRPPALRVIAVGPQHHWAKLNHLWCTLGEFLSHGIWRNNNNKLLFWAIKFERGAEMENQSNGWIVGTYRWANWVRVREGHVRWKRISKMRERERERKHSDL